MKTMKTPSTKTRQAHKVDYFPYISNEHLSDEFLGMMDDFKDRILSGSSLYGFDIEESSLDTMDFFQLATLIERKFDVDFITLESRIDGRYPTFDETLISHMAVAEIKYIWKTNKYNKDYSFLFQNTESFRNFRINQFNSGLMHDSRKLFYTCYMGSFIRNSPERFLNAIDTAAGIVDDSGFPSDQLDSLNIFSLKMINNALILSASAKISDSNFLIAPSKNRLAKLVKRFNSPEMRNLLSLDFLGADLAEISQAISEALKWFENQHLTPTHKDMLIGHWFSPMCAMYFACHQDADRLRAFIDAVISPLGDVLEFSTKDMVAVKEMITIQVMLLEPAIFKQEGYTKQDMLRPLRNCSAKLSTWLHDSQRLFTRSDDKDYLWLADVILCEMVKQSQLNLTPAEIVEHCSNTDFKYHALSAVRPEGYLEYLISNMNSASIAQLYKTANELQQLYNDDSSRHDIQLAYLIKIVSRNGDKPLSPNRMGLKWLDKNRLIDSLRDKNLLGHLSTITLLGLDADDLMHDMDSLSTKAKRHLLAHDLDL
jgi:hypothetical protein